MKSLDDLPNNLKLIIFEYLCIKDLAKCRLVSKKWQKFVDRLKLKDLILVIKHNNERDIDGEWYFTGLSKDLIGDVIFALRPATKIKLNLIKKHLKMEKFANLKNLQLIFTEWHDDGLKNEHALCDFILKNMQKQFPLLEQLEIEMDDATLSEHKEIKHKNIKVLYMNDFEEQSVDLTIDCSSLKVLYWGGMVSQLNTLTLKHRNSLTWFGASLYNNYRDDKFTIELSSLFKNLVTFDFNGLTENFDRKDIIKLKKLKELRFSKSLDFIAENEEEDYQESYEQFVDDVAYVLNKRPDIKFFLQGVQMNECEMRSELQKFIDENTVRRKENGW